MRLAHRGDPGAVAWLDHLASVATAVERSCPPWSRAFAAIGQLPERRAGYPGGPPAGVIHVGFIDLRTPRR